LAWRGLVKINSGDLTEGWVSFKPALTRAIIYSVDASLICRGDANIRPAFRASPNRHRRPRREHACIAPVEGRWRAFDPERFQQGAGSNGRTGRTGQVAPHPKLSASSRRGHLAHAQCVGLALSVEAPRGRPSFVISAQSALWLLGRSQQESFVADNIVDHRCRAESRLRGITSSFR
jgi:hypothetical protein